MKAKEKSPNAKWSFSEILMVVSFLVIFAAFALQEKDLSFPTVGKILLIVGGASFITSFICMLCKNSLLDTKEKSSNEA